MSNKDNKSCASTRIKRNMNKIFVYGTLKSTKIQKELFLLLKVLYIKIMN